MPYPLKVWIPNALGLVICMADVVTDMRRLAAKFTYSAHDSSFLSAHIELGQLFLIGQKILYIRMHLE